MAQNELTLLKRENDNQALNLTPDDWQMIKKIMKSMSIFRVNSYDREVIRRDLIGMAQELKLRGSSLQEAIGDDVKGFADEIVKNSGGPCKREIRLRFSERLFGMFLFFSGLTVVFGYGNLSGRLNPIVLYLYYIAFVVIGFVLEEIISPLFAAEKGFKKTLLWFISISSIIALVNVSIFLSGGQYIREVKAGSKFGPEVIPTLIIAAIGLLITKHLNTKNIQVLAKDKKNFIDDLK